MYVYKHRLAIRDKANWQKWHHSPLYDTIEQVFTAYKDWLAKHPGAIVSFMQERVFVPEGAQSLDCASFVPFDVHMLLLVVIATNT